MDMIIKIKDLQLITNNIGVYEWEKMHQRKLMFNVVIETDFIKGAKSDNLEDAIDYDVIVNKIKNFVNNNHCQLIEKMVKDLLDLIMQDKRIKKCQLEIDKLKVYDFVDSFSVTQTKLR